MPTVIPVRSTTAPSAAAPARARHTRPSATRTPPPSKEELLRHIKDHLMTAQMVAELAGIEARSVSIYHTVAPFRMPQPDVRLGRTPLWWRETIEEWNDTRPKKRDKVRE